MIKSKVRDGEATKKKIIKTAEKLFSKKGFNGVSIRDLANKCGLSGPLILHHFKSKDGLYDAVRLSLIEDYIPFFENRPDETEDLFCFIEDVVRGIFDFHYKNPIALRLMNWDRLNGFNTPWPKTEEFHRIFTERLRKAMDTGEIGSEFSADYFAIMICGMSHFWTEKRDFMMRDKLGDKYNQAAVEKADEEYIQHILLFAKKSLNL
jgi:TetR/AcrR family transcriptional regulator